MIPQEELDRANEAIREAAALAAEGLPMQGFEVLDLALAWAETPALNPITGESAAPEPWTEPLVHMLRLAMVRYEARRRWRCPYSLTTDSSLAERVSLNLARSQSLCTDAERLRLAAEAVRLRVEARRQGQIHRTAR